MNKISSMVAIYPSHTAAEAAIKELQQAGFEQKNLSIVGRDDPGDDQVVGFYQIGDRVKIWGRTAAIWDGLLDSFSGCALFCLPGLGPLLIAGPLVGLIVAALEGVAVVGGLSALGAAWYSIGIPIDSILRYETALKAGKFILCGEGSATATTPAEEILARTVPETLDHHGKPTPP